MGSRRSADTFEPSERLAARFAVRTEDPVFTVISAPADLVG
jgi:hypothetical protein